MLPRTVVQTLGHVAGASLSQSGPHDCGRFYVHASVSWVERIMAQILGEYVTVLKEATRLEHTIAEKVDCIQQAMSRLAQWQDDGCWDWNVRQIGWDDIPSYDQVLELVQAWRDAQTELEKLETLLSADERSEMLN